MRAADAISNVVYVVMLLMLLTIVLITYQPN